MEYAGKAADIPTKLAVVRKAARAGRLATNRTVTSETCTATEVPMIMLDKAA
jgi:hypothetical protein